MMILDNGKMGVCMACDQRFLCSLMAGVSLLLLGGLTACQGAGAAAGPAEVAPTRGAEASILSASNEPGPNSSADASQIEAIASSPTLTDAPTPAPLPTETPRKSVEEISNTWETSDNLAHTHLVAQMKCQNCHNQEWPPEGPAPTEACLACHGGSYAGMTALTQDRSPNPHDFHMGELSCPFCHLIHEPYRDPCKLCH